VNVSGFPYYHESTSQLFLNNDNKCILKFNNQSNTWKEFIKPGGAVIVLSNGDLWVDLKMGIQVSDSSGKFRQQIPVNTIVPPGSTGTFVSCTYETRDGVVWLGTNGYGLKKYNPQTSRFGYIGASPNAAIHLSHAYVDAIYTSDDTTLYVSTPAGLDIINLMKNTSQHLSPPTRIVRMTTDDTGTLWCTAWEALYTLKNNRFIKVSDWADFHATDLKPDQADISWLNDNLKKGGSKFKELFLPQLLSGDSLWTNISGVGAHINWIDLTITNINTGKILRSFKYDPSNPTSAPRSESIKIIFQDSQ
jgi:ligand-binding sensor domain-containing protein